jgi:phytoene synthase
MTAATVTHDAVLRQAVATTRRHAHTFALATRLLPRSVRDDVYLLYLVCRTLDDLVDDHHPEAASRLSQVRRWAEGGRPTGREERILDELFQRHPAMPREAIADFCEGQAFDLRGEAINDEAQLDHYAYQVAGTVGRLMVAMLGPRSPAADASGRALGNAMQRTNILRDMDEDLGNGRIYIPAQTLAFAHVNDLRRDDRRLLLRLEIAIADNWYERGMAVVDQVSSGRFAVRVAALMYREILRQIERLGLGAVRPQRAVVPLARKLRLLVGAGLHE